MTLDDSVNLLRRMIATPSVSRDEKAVADLLQDYMQSLSWPMERVHNCLWAKGDVFIEGRPTLLLNSHIDTVKPTTAYTRDPHSADVVDGRLYGLGSNDAGASVVSLMAAFDAVRSLDLGYNIILATTAEEEVMGENGMRAFLPEMERQGIHIDMALVGEPTGMQAAVGERGLLVLDCTAHGPQGHAARHYGDTSILMAMRDIERLRTMQFDRKSALLGDIKITVTQIDAGTQHNVVPDTCRFVADIRTTDAYTNEQVVEMVRHALESDVKERSTRVRASALSNSHPLVQAAVALGRETFVSPTTSDMAVMPFPSLKMGPGQSPRSHSADEYVLIDEIAEGIDLYIKLLHKLSEKI